MGREISLFEKKCLTLRPNPKNKLTIMNKPLLIAGLGLLLSVPAFAQDFVQGKKWDAGIQYEMQRARGFASITQDPTLLYVSTPMLAPSVPVEIPVIIRTTDAKAVADFITRDGYTANVITENTLTARVPALYVERVAEIDEVLTINRSVQSQLFMEKARKDTGVDKIHAGTGLDTPYTGKGVVLGVIDQGFEYLHIGFLEADGETPRAKWVWDRSKSMSTKPKSSEEIRRGGDAGGGGHATHVTNIAAGSKIEENNFYGVAPEAELIMVPSTFNHDEVLEDIKFIKEKAEEEGKPWVVNMSFGSQMGPHDGTSNYSQAAAALTKDGGAFLVAAMGNEGNDNLHSEWTFEEDGETVYINVDPGQSGSYFLTYLDVWGQSADGKKHLTVRPFVYNSGKFTYFDENSPAWKDCGQFLQGIDPNNHKEYYQYYINVSQMRQLCNIQNGNFGLEITGEAGVTIHSWLNPLSSAKECTYASVRGKNYMRGDNQFCAAEGGASIPTAIAVGSYNSSLTFWSEVNNREIYYSQIGDEGGISSFSSRGPLLDPTYPKPMISAPGAEVCSAISSYADGFSKTDDQICDIVKRGTRSYYYSAMQGTSMATPFVSGTICLWLQADPNLTYEDIQKVFRETARTDSYTGQMDENGWNRDTGYGKLDAYNGLKKVLEIKAGRGEGIHTVSNTFAPVTIYGGESNWRVLFNNDEDFADIRICSTGGQQVAYKHLTNVRTAQEETFDLGAMPAGVYLVNIQTARANLTKKVVVK